MSSKIYYLVHSLNFGDTLCATPTLRYLSQSHRQKINVVTHNKQVFNGNPYIDNLLFFDEYYLLNEENVTIYESFTHAGKLDNNGIEKKFSHIDTRQLHANDLGFQLLPEQLTYDFYPSQQSLDIELPEDYVVLHVTTNWPNRTWSDENWVKLIDWLKENRIFTVLIGSGYREELHKSLGDTPLDKYCPTFDNLYGLDLTNQGSMSDMWWVLNNAKCLVTMDSGPLHLAGCTNVNIIQLGSAIHPSFRAPYRYGRQDFNYRYIGGTCSLFCNSNLFYNIKEWGHINAVPPMPGCLENKSTFECHPSLDKVIHAITEVLNDGTHNKFDSIIELNWNPDPNKIFFNYNVNTNMSVKLEVFDINTGLKRDVFNDTAKRIYDGNIWWAPSPGHLDGLGNVTLKLYLDDKYYGEKELKINGDNYLQVKNKKFKLDNIIDKSYSTFWEVYINKDYESDIEYDIKENDVVLDIGANHGFFSMYSIDKGASEVFAVEPVNTTFKSLLDLSKELPITPINKAVGKLDGKVNMVLCNDVSAKNCLTEYNDILDNDGEEIVVDSVNINTLINQINKKINFLKVDCEGSELDIFNTILDENIKKIDRICIETHEDNTKELILNKLKKLNFKTKIKDMIIFAKNKKS